MKSVAFFLFLVIASGVSLEAQGMRYRDVDRGSRAPDFSLPYATRHSLAFEELSLSSFAGVLNVILAFYPADWSGGCTRETSPTGTWSIRQKTSHRSKNYVMR